MRVALQSGVPTDSNSIRPPQTEGPAEFHEPAFEIWAHDGPTETPQNESVQYGSYSFKLGTTPTRTDDQPETSLQIPDFPLGQTRASELAERQTTIFGPQATQAAKAPIQIVAFSDSRFRPTHDTWRGMLAVNPLPVDRVRPAIMPARYVANTTPTTWSHWVGPVISRDITAQLRVVPSRPRFFARWLAPLNLAGNRQLGDQLPQQHLPVTLKLGTSSDWIQTLRGMQEAIDSSLKSQTRIQPLTGSQDSR